MLQSLFGKSLDFPPESGDETAVLDLMGELILLISIVGDEDILWGFCSFHGKPLAIVSLNYIKDS